MDSYFSFRQFVNILAEIYIATVWELPLHSVAMFFGGPRLRERMKKAAAITTYETLE
jgi:hypothetical protein